MSAARHLSIYAVVVQLGEERAAIALQRNRLQKTWRVSHCVYILLTGFGGAAQGGRASPCFDFVGRSKVNPPTRFIGFGLVPVVLALALLFVK